ncbi:MAG: hypothetical protein Q8K79_21095 [Solirubrobacteraceae bacterium]|nr:hypothetical protein [Solirubrobacteraceae bacterium]
MSLHDDKVALQSALDAGRVTILGERGVPSASASFLLGLSALPPSFRRLGLARACAAPWANAGKEMPECFRRELARAEADAREERGDASELQARLETLFAPDPAPISEHLLRQITDLTPVRRYFSLIFAITDEDAPPWLQRELEYAKWIAHDDYRGG